MGVSVTKRRGSLKDAKKAAAAVAEGGMMRTILCGMLYRIPMLLLLSIFLFIWSSSSIIMSGSFFHVCVSSRKLSDLYCLSAGAHPSFNLPVSLNQTSNSERAQVFDAIRSSFDAINTTSGSNHTTIDSYNSGSSRTTIDNYSRGSTQDSKVGVANHNNDDPDSKITMAQYNNAGVDQNHNDDSASMIANAKAVEEQLELHHPFTPDPDQLTESNGVQNDEHSGGSDDKETTIAKAVKAVEDQLQIHRSWASDSVAVDNTTCNGKGIFVYDLPSEFNKDLLAQCGDMMPWQGSSFCEYMENEAMGRPIPALGKGWYRTHQYSLEPLLHAKVLRHPCRVYNPDEAKLFYVPYYGGLDILRWHFKKNTSDDVKDELGLKLVNWLGAQKSWDRNNGKDHVFVLGKISWDFRRTVKDGWGTRFLHLEQMQNPIKLLIERQPWDINDIGIPHPTHFHPQSDDDIIAWQSKIISSSRKNLVAFAGAERPEDPDTTRSILIDQCKSRTDGACQFQDCKSGGCSNPETLIQLFTESEFCLQPPGDSPTRKSVFDSLIAGCIPVMLDPFTAFYQYPWHLPEDHGKYSVFVGKEELKQMNLNVVDNLKEVPKTERDEMRRFIVYQLLPGLVYGDYNSQLQRFQDAFSISINHLLNRVSKLE